MRSGLSQRIYRALGPALVSVFVLVAGGGLGYDAGPVEGEAGTKDDRPYVCVYFEKWGVRRYYCVRVPDPTSPSPEKIVESGSEPGSKDPGGPPSREQLDRAVGEALRDVDRELQVLELG